jgi:hypothetical protein
VLLLLLVSRRTGAAIAPRRCAADPGPDRQDLELGRPATPPRSGRSSTTTTGIGRTTARSWTRQEAARGFLESLASEVPGSTRTRITIDSLFVREDTAVVYTRQHYARNPARRPTRRPMSWSRTWSTVSTGWRTPEGWKVRYLEEVAEGPFTLDGPGDPRRLAGSPLHADLLGGRGRFNSARRTSGSESRVPRNFRSRRER